MAQQKHNLIISGMLILLFVGVSSGLAKTGTDNVRLFQSYFLDAPIAKTHHIQPGLSYAIGENTNILTLGANGGFAASNKLEILAGLNYINEKTEGLAAQDGLSDMALYARYKLSKSKDTQLAAGGIITLPIGSEDVGEGNFNFGAYSAVRHHLKGGMVITGNLALMFYDAGDKHESSVEIGGGAIYPVDRQLSLIGELNIQSETDFMMISGGVDYNMGGGHIRGAIGIGLDDGAPDFKIIGGYLLSF